MAVPDDNSVSFQFINLPLEGSEKVKATDPITLLIAEAASNMSRAVSRAQHMKSGAQSLSLRCLTLLS